MNIAGVPITEECSTRGADHTMIYKSLFVIFHIKVVQNCFIWGYHNLQRQFEVRNLVEYVKTSVLKRNTTKILLNVG